MSGGGYTRNNFLGHGTFEKIISLENLFLAWDEFKKGKRSKSDVQNFEFNLEDNIFKLNQELLGKTYKHSDYIPFYITDPKVWHIHKAIVRDRVVHHAIFRVLYPAFDSSFIYDSYSCRNNKGTHRAVKRLKSFSLKVSRNNSVNFWSLKCDVSRFFNSIDQNILLNLLQERVQDQDLMWLLKVVITSFVDQKNKGVPLGNVTSQLFANIYLNELDWFVKHRLKFKYYLRYCDDFVFLAKERKDLERLVPILQLFLRKSLKLILHPRKIIFRKYSQGIDFLGYVIRPHSVIIRTRTRRRMFNKLCKKIYNNQPITQSLPSYLGMLKHANSEKIKAQLLKLA